MPSKKNVILICHGRFHHFHLARQMERHGRLKFIVSGYPRFKLKDESGIPKDKIICKPFWKLAMVILAKLKITNINMHWWCNRALIRSLSKSAIKKIAPGDIVIGLSGAGLDAGKKAKSLGGYFICDRGSTHIQYQNDLLNSEYERWGMKWAGIDPMIIEREKLEYELADFITIPSEFSYKSFIEKGVDKKKLRKIVYGARLDRFKPSHKPDHDCFNILWVGGITMRKGFLDALHAFQGLDYKRKSFLVVGHLSNEIKMLLEKENLENVQFLGTVPNIELINYYCKSHVFVLPSIEDGFGMVQSEAMACGCPVIASNNTGALDLLNDGIEGYIIPIRSPDELKKKLNLLAHDRILRDSLSEKSLSRVQLIGGWDVYGDHWEQLLTQIDEF